MLRRMGSRGLLTAGFAGILISGMGMLMPLTAGCLPPYSREMSTMPRQTRARAARADQ